MSNTDSKEVYLRARLKEEILEKFKRLKKFYGVEADAELIRILISKVHNEIYDKL